MDEDTQDAAEHQQQMEKWHRRAMTPGTPEWDQLSRELNAVQRRKDYEKQKAEVFP